MLYRARILLLGCLPLCMLWACEGPRGPRGEPGPPGVSADGGPSGVTDAGLTDGSTNGAGLVLSGTVRDGSGQPLTQGSVVLLAAQAVSAMSETPLPSVPAEDTLGDEPVEDALDMLDGAAPQAPLGSDGTFAFATLPADDAFFVVFVPDPDDDQHLPGGNLARGAQSRDSLFGARLSIEVSGVPTSGARYVGSAPCLQCHGRHSLFGSAHRVGLTRPEALGAGQDASRFVGLDGLRAEAAAGTVLHFSACDAGLSERARCRVTTQPPPGDLWFDATLGTDGNHGLTLTLNDRRGSGEQVTFPVLLRYGGALGRQQWIVDVSAIDAPPRLVPAPFAWNLAGNPEAEDPADLPFVEADAGRFYDFQAERLRSPDATDSFSLKCAGCHYTGFALTTDTEAQWRATAVPSLIGAFDTDGDGRLEEINVGCESCHGPGSEHLQARDRGAHIVAPQLLTASRATLICGACHGRAQGLFDNAGHAPLNAAGQMPRPGMRRAAFLRDHLAPAEKPEGDLWPSGDTRRHFQQYDEFVRSRKHRNGVRLLACDDCHNAHNADDTASEVRLGGGDALCSSCHGEAEIGDVGAHTARTTGEDHALANRGNMTCNDCHMPRTGLRGAQRPALLDILPRTAEPFQYYHGDVTSHRFRSYARSEAQTQPTPFTAACAPCHGQWLSQP